MNNTDSFALLFPDVDKEALLKDEDFSSFAEGKLDTGDIATVYKSYLDLTERIKARERERALSILEAKQSAVGPLSSALPSESAFFTKEEVRSMSKAQIKENYEKIRKSQQKWL